MSLFDVLDDGRTTLDPVPELAYDGRAPLRFTTAYFTPAELDAAADQVAQICRSTTWEERREFAGVRSSWHRASWLPSFAALGHGMDMFVADMRCDNIANGHREAFDWPHRCPWVGGLFTMAVCQCCSWHAIGWEGQVAAWWHDHAMPGWRSLPVVPRAIGQEASLGLKGGRKGLERWVEREMPEAWRFRGAPVITERDPNGFGTRSHLGGALGGWDLSSTVLDVAELEPLERGVRLERTAPGVDYWTVWHDGARRGDVRGTEGGGIGLVRPHRDFDTRDEAVAWVVAGRPLPAGCCPTLRDEHPFYRCDLADGHDGDHRFAPSAVAA